MERIRYLGELMGTSQQPQVLLDACTALPPTEPNNESHSPQSIPGAAEEEPGGSAEEEVTASFDDSASAFPNSSIADNSLESTSAVRPSRNLTGDEGKLPSPSIEQQHLLPLKPVYGVSLSPKADDRLQRN